MQHVLLRKWGDGLIAGHLPNSLASLHKANGYNHKPLYVGTWGPFGGSAPVWCVQVMLYERIELWCSCDSTYISRCTTGYSRCCSSSPNSFCQELRDHDNQHLNEKEKGYVQKIEDLQAWERVQE
jgi:hypothetical protein